MISSIRSLGFALAVVAITAPGTFIESTVLGDHHGNSHECRQCPSCNYVCKLTVEKIDEEKIGFDVESKVICIPRVVFPWQKKCNPCANNGGRLRSVCVLTTEKFKCPKCEYTWKAEKQVDPCEKATEDAEAEAPKMELPAPLPNPQDTPPPSELPVQTVTQVEPFDLGTVYP